MKNGTANVRYVPEADIRSSAKFNAPRSGNVPGAVTVGI